MGGGPIIIIDPDKVKSSLSTEETIDRLRNAADALEAGEMTLETSDESE